MWEFELSEIEKKYGALQGMALIERALKMIEPILKKYKGTDLEDVLWIFEDSDNALKSAIEIKNMFLEYNKTEEDEKWKIKVTGFGMHTGKMLFIEGTDIHWGDLVNTSSKLGQDLAKDGQILIMPVVYEKAFLNKELFNSLNFKKLTLKRSKVDFLCYEVT